MTDKQKVIDLLDEYDMGDSSFSDDLLALIEHGHAEIERLNAAATDSNLILERAQATNLEMLAAIERKDALLRQALEALDGVLDKYGEPINVMSISGGLYEVAQCNDAISAIKKEIAS